MNGTSITFNERQSFSTFRRLPFLDFDFPRQDLLAAVTEARRSRDTAMGRLALDLESYLNPVIARDLYPSEENSYNRGTYDAHSELLRKVETAKATIRQAMPEWRDYFSIPIRLLEMNTDAYFGYSNVVEPQHIYLSSVSQHISDDDLLLENFLHEFAHIWLYFLEELTAFETGQHLAVYTLPSGTTGRTLTATIDAAFVATILRCYYARTGDIARRRELAAYIGGCLLEIRDDPNFTTAGRDVCLRLAEELTIKV